MVALSKHSQVLELLHHLDGELAPMKAEGRPWSEWSDGDKLRLVAHSQLQAIHVATHLGAPDELGPVRDLLRIAARLDLVDEQEAADE